MRCTCRYGEVVNITLIIFVVLLLALRYMALLVFGLIGAHANIFDVLSDVFEKFE